MFVRQNSCIPLDEGSDDHAPIPTSAVSTPVPESPAISDDKLKIKSRYDFMIQCMNYMQFSMSLCQTILTKLTGGKFLNNICPSGDKSIGLVGFFASPLFH